MWHLHTHSPVAPTRLTLVCLLLLCVAHSPVGEVKEIFKRLCLVPTAVAEVKELVGSVEPRSNEVCACMRACVHACILCVCCVPPLSHAHLLNGFLKPVHDSRLTLWSCACLHAIANTMIAHDKLSREDIKLITVCFGLIWLRRCTQQCYRAAREREP